MLNPQGYQNLITQIERKGGKPITSYAEYIQCHHLPGWYLECMSFTAETYFFEADDNLQLNVEKLGWDRYFVKDFVKSNTAETGSIANSPSKVCLIVKQLATYRGEIEGGVAIRRVENYLPHTERRYFVVRGVPYAPDGKVPELVEKVANLVDAQFYSVDVAENITGELRVVELGDGQVSDKKTWQLSTFVEVIGANA